VISACIRKVVLRPIIRPAAVCEDHRVAPVSGDDLPEEIDDLRHELNVPDFHRLAVSPVEHYRPDVDHHHAEQSIHAYSCFVTTLCISTIAAAPSASKSRSLFASSSETARCTGAAAMNA
jgi:hypothetical protein